jgi:hypothetical protein
MTIRLNWGGGIALVYVLFALSTAGFVVFAVEHPEPLVSSEYYEDALRHDGRRTATANANALGPAVGCTISADRQTLVLQIPSDQRATAYGTVRFYRASDAAADRSLPLVVDERGVQTIPVEGLLAGRWRVRVEWTANGTSYYYEHILELP